MKPPNGETDINEFGQLRAFLARSGFKQAWIKSVIGDTPAGQTRKQITDKLRAAMALLPKA